MSRLYMLDTDTASYLIRGGSTPLDRRIATVPPEQVCISSITRAELLYGLRLKPEAHRLARLVGQFLAGPRCLAWDATAADCYAAIAAELTAAGTPIGTFDTLIAAHALAAEAVLVSNNTRHFSQIADLVLENWIQD